MTDATGCGTIRAMRKLLSCLLVLVFGVMAAQGRVKVASLHPLLSEMAQAVGGEQVEVVNLFPKGADLHTFNPTAADLARARDAALVLACGMGVEPYLDDLKDSLPSVSVVEPGKSIPPVYLPGTQQADPHWWNAPQNMKRASRVLMQELMSREPAQKAVFRAGQKAYAAEMDALDREARVALGRLPQESRVLVAAHAAMGHFGKAYGFRQVAVHGIAQESEGDTATMARLLRSLRELRVRCIFTEATGSPRAMETLAGQVGAATRPLVMDGIHPEMRAYREIFNFNIRNIVDGLGQTR